MYISRNIKFVCVKNTKLTKSDFKTVSDSLDFYAHFILSPSKIIIVGYRCDNDIFC